MSITLPSSFSYSLPPARVFIIGLAGGADSGKEALCRVLIEEFEKSQVVDSEMALLLHLQDFYMELSDENRTSAVNGHYNFDHPDAFDWDLLGEVIDNIKEGRISKLPKFDFTTKTRSYDTWSPDREIPSVVLLEGIFVLYNKRIRDQLNMKARLTRKVAEPSPDSMDHILTEYVRFVKPAFDDFIQPSKKWADIIIPRGIENTAALKLITAHAVDLLGRQRPQSRSTRPSRMNSSSGLQVGSASGSASSSTCPSPRAGATHNESGSRSNLAQSPVMRKDILTGVPDSAYNPVPQ
ncbi:UMP-CMP kinase [Mortierella polycephala]|uniref:uridine/cytidine kinase n=1 Tax=Mortierella polycephala TaxID=41804 RepID=A0A9P6U7C6_9FUNG|nr:UMP-CMP kinase [Mortierella polycephala]